MTEVTIPSVDEFTLNVEDWDIACGINPAYHESVGTGAAVWAMWWNWNHVHAKPFQYACAGCHDRLVNHPALIIVCRHCGECLPGPMRHYLVRHEKIKP